MNQAYDSKAWSHAGGRTFVGAVGEYGKAHNPSYECITQLKGSFNVDPREKTDNLELTVTAMEHMVTLPSMESFVSLLHDCAKSKELAYAKCLHAQFCSNGLDVLGNHVILMLAECGGLREAQQVFDKLFSINDFCWSSLIKGYAQCGDLHHALKLFREMQEKCIPSNKGMLVALVQACTRSQCVETGHYIHTEIAREGYESDVFVGSVLVDMYGKCHQILEAQDVFNELPYRDTVAWTALIGGYGEHGLGAEAYKCLEEMQLEGVYPDASTFVCVLKACGSIEVAQSIHAEATKEGYDGNQFVSSSLIHTYAICGLLAEARDMLGELAVQGDVAWTALIGGYVEHKLGEEAIKSYEQMIMEGVCPNSSTFVCCLKACSIVRLLETGQKLHSEVLKIGCEAVSFVGNSLVDMYGKCGAPREAQDVFNKLPVQDDVSWNTLISCLVELELGEEALACAEQMLSKEMHPGAVTFVSCLKACGSMGSIDKGRSIHSKIVYYGFDFNAFISNSLVDMYAKCGALVEAHEVFDKLHARDVVSWNSLIAGYAKHGLSQEAHRCLFNMHLEAIFPDVVSWNSVILGFAENAEHEKAREPYALMQEQGLLPDHVTFVNLLKTCHNTTALGSGKRLHTQVRAHGSLPAYAKLTLTNALMDMYSGCGSMVDTQMLFDESRLRNAVTWNSLITGYARQGEIDSALHYFERMLEAGIKPCEITFLSVLTACSHAGLGDRAENYFELMNNVYGITASVYHHNCLVDLLVRAGQLNKAAIMLENLSLKPDPVIWNTMLGACQKLGDVELEKVVHECALK